MDHELIIGLVLLIVSGVFTVLWGLLRSKDLDQEKKITELMRLHYEDAKRLQDLELEIARRHYVKDELDTRFEGFNSSFKEGFSSLGSKFDHLTNTLISYMNEGSK